MVWFRIHPRSKVNMYNFLHLELRWLSRCYHTKHHEKLVLRQITTYLSSLTSSLSSKDTRPNGREHLAVVPKYHSTWIQPEGFDTGIKVYNTLTKQKEKLILLRKNIATWYICGPTVYDSAHLGHASTYIQFDIIRRILTKIFGIHVIRVMSITDVDDKIIDRANKLGTEISEVSKKFEYEFFHDMALLNVLPPTYPARVTDHMDSIINCIQTILQKGFAYKTPGGSVYFNVEAYPDYGQLRQKQEIFEESTHEGKHSSLDFALWKATKQGPSWESPWGKGRPGWHIECSAMASKIFGSNFDLHSGGEDLIFPHHENELAQSQTYHGCKQWCNYWLHTGHLHIKDQEKMSKSLKNVVLISDLLKTYTANQFRFFCMLTHYRRRIAYHKESIEKASKLLTQIESYLQNSSAYILGQKNCRNISESEILSKLDQLQTSVGEALCDDFDLPRTIASIISFVQFMNNELTPTQDPSSSSRSTVAVAVASMYVSELLQSFGINFGKQTQETESSSDLQLSQVINSTVKYRNKIRQFVLSPHEDISFGKDYEDLNKKEKKKLKFQALQPLISSSDDIRKEFAAMDIQIIDYQNDSSWKIVTTKKKKEN
ncbi:probable cysteine--tRNA ligase, mitochondrial [Octopus bimaculoides]|uniref:cysteine--tRNA ligase n=1 Tax=Octopus bimaculoides TaxID=37653 RepID=A0A0L8I9W8_OCTBM|nr:probable cysteine--tRNA ligase, mitochondrial [Octopus bimaculoides]XP_014786069.1 probable cysteine--tRNA ligase, mitochondrial [Octopus bimaculoides]XP_014786077.1 probable cysteine--tRNA ligase, mitochondrial [Octopus bimaculoides]XP_014786084.1 probable cysteine--tRNA ligase, mitochondrial [Octopus bimaculoides]XP_014786094.1 probable cysteine--tRNA ligase, mitochondrial [Octopus bimaculoides]|eukprot:XP_014786062.1 PREDICTED: probable cysteine--tRNA ligase, mitochondrial [Octopus bimaculoides]